MTAEIFVRHPDLRVEAITWASYRDAGLQHTFLTGDLRKASPHPFFRDARIELIACDYAAGDDGLFHWHKDVTEYQLILSGSVGIVEAATQNTRWFGPGDLSLVPAGVCVQRLVPEATRTVALKVPSRPTDKLHCAGCARVCVSRQQPFEGAAS